MALGTDSRSVPILNGKFYVAAISNDGEEILEHTEIDVTEVKTYVSPLGINVLLKDGNFKITGSVDYFLDRTRRLESFPKDLQNRLGITLGKRLLGFRKWVEQNHHSNGGLTIITTYGMTPRELLETVELNQIIAESSRR